MEGERRARSTTRSSTSGPSTRSGSSSRTRSRSTTIDVRGERGAARRRRRRQVAAAAGVPHRARASPTTSTSATTRCGPRSRRPTCRSAATSASTPGSTSSQQRDPTPQKGVIHTQVGLATGEALGMWLVTGVLERFPQPQGRVRGARPRLDRVVPVLHRRHGRAAAATSSPRSPRCRASTSTATCTSRSSTSRWRCRTCATSSACATCMWSTDYPHPVTSWPNSRALAEASMAGVPADERELMLSANSARVWNL